MRRTLKQKLLYYSRPEFYEKLIRQLTELEERIVWLLSKTEHLRNCDKCLIHTYWRQVDQIAYTFASGSDVVHKLTCSEMIRRTRQRIQNTIGYWPPTDKEVIKTRKIKQEVIEAWSKQSNWMI